MMDRLIHTAHKLELKGGSMREYLAKKRPLNIPCQSNSDRRNPITPELKF